MTPLVLSRRFKVDIEKIRKAFRDQPILSKLTGHWEGGLSLGIDVGTGGLRYVLWDPRQRKVVQWGRCEGEQDERGSAPVDRPIRSLKAWSQRIPRRRLQSTQVNIQDNSVNTGMLHLPEDNRADEASRVRLALKERLHMPLEDTVYFYSKDEPISQSAPGTGEKAPALRHPVFFGAASRARVFELIDLVEENLHVMPRVHLQGDIDRRVVEFLHLSSKGEAIAFLNVGRSTTILSIFQRGKLRFQRHLPLAGQDMTRALLMGYLKDHPPRGTSSLARAEELKRSCALSVQVQNPQSPLPVSGERKGEPFSGGFMGSAVFEGGLDEEGENQKILESIDGVLKALIQDIRMSFEVYRKQEDSLPVSKVYLHGGGAQFKNIAAYLGAELGVEAAVLAAPAHGTLTLLPQEKEKEFRRDFYEYATALGLALVPDPSTSLTPTGIGNWRTMRYVMALFRSASLVVGFIFLLAFTFFTLEVKYLREVEKILAEHRGFLSKVEAPFLEMVQWKKLVEEFSARHRPVAGMLGRLSEVIPPNVFFTQLSVGEDHKITIGGVVLGGAKRRAVTLAEYVQGLRGTGLFETLQVSTVEERETEGQGLFRLEGALKTGGPATP